MSPDSPVAFGFTDFTNWGRPITYYVSELIVEKLNFVLYHFAKLQFDKDESSLFSMTHLVFEEFTQ